MVTCTGVVRGSGQEDPAVDSPPKVIARTTPIYPEAMRRSGVEGEVIVNFVVSAEGEVVSAHVERSSHPGFREAAIAAVQQWRFEPALKDSRKVNAMMRMPLYFGIDRSTVSGGTTSKLRRPILGDINAGTKPVAVPPVEPNRGWQFKRPKKWGEEVPESCRWDEAPEMLEYSPPVYPRAALLARKKAKVTVSFVVGPDGAVAMATALEPAVDPQLSRAAVAAVEAFKFKPARQAGQPCSAILKMEFDLRPSSKGDAPYSKETQRIANLLADEHEQLATIDELDQPPRAVVQRAPTIPPKLRQADTPAEALVEFVINRNGLVFLPKVVETTDEAFGYAAVQAVGDWGFMAPMRDGEAVDTLVRVPVVYRPTAVVSTAASR